MSEVHKSYKCIALIAAVAAITPAARATENDESHASFGYIDTLSGLPLAPGFYARDDVSVQSSNRLNDQDGNKVAIRLGPNRQLAIKYRETAVVDILTAAYVPDYKIPYINASVGTAIFEGYVSPRVGLTSRLGIPERRGEDSAGFSDLNVVPAFFGFDIPRTDFHFVFSPFSFAAPIGRYSRSLESNIGLNYWSYRPSLQMTYLNKTGQEFDLQATGNVNSQNPVTHYKSGNEFYLGFAAQQYLSPHFAFGFGGYYYKQIGNDTQNGRTVDATPATDPLNGGPGNRGETFGIGPVVSYNPTNRLAFEGHWDHEVFAYNRDLRDIVYVRGALRF